MHSLLCRKGAAGATGTGAMPTNSCTAFNHTSQSYWPSSTPASSPLPFVVLFDGSSGSSWFADALDRHTDIFISGYEPLEWVGNVSYAGWSATSWQPSWLRTVWQRPQAGAWSEWLSRYHHNAKLNPAVHHAPLTVRMPTEAEVRRASAVGFKVRPSTIADNHLAGTLKQALQSLGGVVIVINRRSKLEQSVSLFRRRFEGKANQFGVAGVAKPSAPTGAAGAQGGGPDGPGGNPWAGFIGSASSAGGSGSEASVINAADLTKLFERRQAQEEAIECLVALLDRPTLRIAYEDLQVRPSIQESRQGRSVRTF